MEKNKFLLLFVLLFIATSVLGCSKSNQNAVNEPSITPQPHTQDVSKSTVAYGDTPKIEVVQSVSCIFDGLEGNELYLACEYKNTSDCPAIINDVTYNITLSGEALTVNSTQPASIYCTVYPNETFYNAIWYDKDCLPTDTVSIVSIDITCEKSNQEKSALEISDLYMVHNYPEFATVSGNITSEKSFSLNEIYMGFYDKDNKLLGVWYFTDAAELVPDAQKHFTTHLRSLPIENIVENTAQIRASGFGFNEK